MWNIQDFVSDFNTLIDSYKEDIEIKREDSIEQLKRKRENPSDILELLLRAKVSKGYYRPRIADQLSNTVNGRWHIRFLKSDKGEKTLLENLKLYSNPEGQYNNLKKFLFDELEVIDIRDWLQNEKKVKEVLPGNKMRNVFLRDCKSYEYVPIDRHEKRFLIRTGIFFHYLSEKINNPNNEKHYEEALSSFSREFLSGVMIGEYDLGESPGLVDKFIWLHCANKKEEKNNGGKEICAIKPNCDYCLLSKSCLLSTNLK